MVNARLPNPSVVTVVPSQSISVGLSVFNLKILN